MRVKMKSDLLLLLNKYQYFIRFVVVGFINTFNYYTLYIILIFFGLPYIFSHSLAFIISMIGSFYLNCYFTYKIKPTLKKFFQFPMTYVVNYTITTISLYLFIDILNMNEFIAPLISAILPIPFTYIVSKLILTKD